jgi:phosphoglycerate dehydrogenase-like enzyme
VHAAGTVKHFVTDACWERGIRVSSAAWANALPVAEYTVAAILLANKQLLQIRDAYRAERGQQVDWHARFPGAGNYGRTIGIVGASKIGRRVIELLRPHDLTLLVFDPFLSRAEAAALGAESVSIDELCERSDLVSLHAPDLPTTRQLLNRARLAAMRDGTTVINTARGALVDADALELELVSGRLNAVIDITEPEILPARSPLYDLPNVVLTPHIAGSLGNEKRRLFDAALGELGRYAAGFDFAHPVSRRDLERSA